MNDVIFVKTRYQDIGYGSYVDLWRLVELSGYPICYVDEIDVTDKNKTWIISPLNGEWLTGWSNARSRIIHLELEWRSERVIIPGVSETWAGDLWYADKIGARYVPLGSHIDLNEDRLATHDFAFDVALMAYREPFRRAHIINEMIDLGLSIAPNAWGMERSIALKQSKCMVHIHQLDAYPCVAPLRMCIAAAHQLPVVTEQVNDRGIFQDIMPQVVYNDLAEMVAYTIRNPNNKLTEFGQALYDRLCVDYTFRRSIEAAL